MIRDVEIRHAHLFCGLGGGAKGFNRGTARVGDLRARFRCLGGVDIDPASIRDFGRLAGVPGTVLDLFAAEQFSAFHGCAPPTGWREATPADIHAAYRFERPHIAFLSAPCKGFSGLLAENLSRSAKYQALNALTLRGVWLLLEAYKDDPVELIVFENVPRIATRGRALLDQIVALLRAYGYVVAETTHDCGKLGGLAQSRKRFLLVARHAEKVPPFLYQPEQRRLRGVGEILDRMPLPGDPAGGPMHRVPSLQWRTWVRLAFVEAGSDWRSLNRLLVENGALADYGIAPHVGWHAGVLGVKSWSDPATTVTSRSGTTNGTYAVADPRRGEDLGEYGQYGVKGWDETSQAVTGKAAVGAGRFAVADPRYAGEAWASGQFGVRDWSDPAGVVTGQRSPGQGGFSVADPRLEGRPRFNNVFRVVRYHAPSPAVAGAGGPGNGLAVADPRAAAGFGGKGKYRVTSATEPAGTVIAASSTGQGAFAIADPRTGFGGGTHTNVLKVTSYAEHARTVTGSTHPAGGALSVADPRTGFGLNSHSNKLKVVGYDDVGPTVTGSDRVGSGALSVADPRPGFTRDGREAYVTGGHYGVVDWDAPSGGVTASGQHDNGRWSVADPRLHEKVGGVASACSALPPGAKYPERRELDEDAARLGVTAGETAPSLPAPDDRLVAVIEAEDGTWHRPFTTLELAALQSLVDPDEQLELDGLSDSSWRERIGNAVPPDAATAIAGVMGTTLLLAWSGQGFVLSSQPIWVRPVAVALSVDLSSQEEVGRC